MKKRMTNQKRIIMDFVEKSREHHTAEEIFNILNRENPQISRATVFRNLKELSDTGVLKKIELFGDADRYDIIKPHYHAKCVECKNIFDLDFPYNEDYNLIDTSHEIISHDLVYKIVCDKCKKERR